MKQKTKSRSRLSYANVTATLALFVALGGSAYAATALPANSVGSAQIKPSAVGASDLADGAVHGSDVADGTLRPADFAAEQDPITSVVRRTGPPVRIEPSHSGDASVSCRPGERALGGGGVDRQGFHEYFTLVSSAPRTADDSEGWQVRYYNRSEGSGSDAEIIVAATVVCGR